MTHKLYIVETKTGDIAMITEDMLNHYEVCQIIKEIELTNSQHKKIVSNTRLQNDHICYFE